jgi:hypothetical protein
VPSDKKTIAMRLERSLSSGIQFLGNSGIAIGLLIACAAWVARLVAGSNVLHEFLELARFAFATGAAMLLAGADAWTRLQTSPAQTATSGRGHSEYLASIVTVVAIAILALAIGLALSGTAGNASRSGYWPWLNTRWLLGVLALCALLFSLRGSIALADKRLDPLTERRGHAAFPLVPAACLIAAAALLAATRSVEPWYALVTHVAWRATSSTEFGTLAVLLLETSLLRALLQVGPPLKRDLPGTVRRSLHALTNLSSEHEPRRDAPVHCRTPDPVAVLAPLGITLTVCAAFAGAGISDAWLAAIGAFLVLALASILVEPRAADRDSTRLEPGTAATHAGALVALVIGLGTVGLALGGFARPLEAAALGSVAALLAHAWLAPRVSLATSLRAGLSEYDLQLVALLLFFIAGTTTNVVAGVTGISAGLTAWVTAFDVPLLSAVAVLLAAQLLLSRWVGPLTLLLIFQPMMIPRLLNAGLAPATVAVLLSLNVAVMSGWRTLLHGQSAGRSARRDWTLLFASIVLITVILVWPSVTEYLPRRVRYW